MISHFSELADTGAPSSVVALESAACRTDRASPNSRAQARQAVDGPHIRELSITSHFSELEDAGAPSSGGRSSPQPVDQIALPGARGQRGCRRARALKSTACRSDCASWNSKTHSLQALGRSSSQALDKIALLELESASVPSGRGRSNP